MTATERGEKKCRSIESEEGSLDGDCMWRPGATVREFCALNLRYLSFCGSASRRRLIPPTRLSYTCCAGSKRPARKA
jgi:hypothetical protein